MINYSSRVETLVSKMTLSEKIGQTFQAVSAAYGKNKIGCLTGPLNDEKISDDFIWQIGSVIDNTNFDCDYLKSIQEEYLKNSRLKIPLLFMSDAIHGYRTMCPIPLALACAFDEKPAFETASLTAKELRAAGIHIAFAPVLDICRDPRWGRITETPGEDPFIGSLMAKAYVKGFQGDSNNYFIEDNKVGSAIKHFAGYGFVAGGRDYDETDFSVNTLQNLILPPFKSAVDAGAMMVMTAFTCVGAVPCTNNKMLLNDILREQMQFKGTIISDYGSVGDVCGYGIAADPSGTVKTAVEAGCDIDMMSFHYPNELEKLIKNGAISESQLDKMVANVLTLKERIGLLDDPFKGICSAENKKYLGIENREISRSVSRKCPVLLKNENILPFSKKIKKIAVIGPMGENVSYVGAWSLFGGDDSVQLTEGIKNVVPNANILFEKGCDIEEDNAGLLSTAINLAKKADAVILALGEHWYRTGENNSRTNINLPLSQIKLAKEIMRVNKSVVATVFTGRPLILQELSDIVPAIMLCWFLGHETGNAVADLLFGDYEPTGRLAVSIPKSMGQIPVYYNRFKTSHFNEDGNTDVDWQTKYTDSSILPEYPFGFGLGYSDIEITDVQVEPVLKRFGTIKAVCNVKNTGKRKTTQVIQLYINDVVAEIAHPYKELKGIKKVELEPNQTKKVVFEISEELLKYYHLDGKIFADNGLFRIGIGKDSSVKMQAEFELI